MSLLQQKKIGYQLQSVNLNDYDGSFMEYLLDKKTSGKYISQLEAHGGSKTHVVGIDCDEKVILDCHEQYALSLSKKNLDYCCGKYLLGVKKIPYCYEVVKGNTKKKSI